MNEGTLNVQLDNLVAAELLHAGRYHVGQPGGVKRLGVYTVHSARKS